MPEAPLLVLTTCPDPAAAERLATRLVEDRLAACVNVIAGVRSSYRWQGKVEHDDEVLVVIKSTSAAFAALQKAIAGASDYELPEVLAVPVSDGSRAYLEWLVGSVDAEAS